MPKKENKPLGFELVKTQRNVFRVNLLVPNYPVGWEQWFLLTSDRHWDNPKSDHDMQRAHLDEAVKRGAGVIDCGDFFCAMQGKADPRSAKPDIRPEHQTGDYFDKLVSTAADFFEPYAHHLLFIARGNHEASVLKRQETDLIQRLVSVLNDRTGSQVHNAGYSGFIRFVLTDKKTRRSIGKSLVAHYSHGTGGGGGTTRGVGMTARKAQYLPDAHIVMSGHIHESWKMDLVRYRLSTQNRTYLDEQTHVLLPTYKQEYDGFEGWHVTTGKPPKPIGAYWLRLFVPRVFAGEDKRLLYEITRAQ